MKNGLIIDEYGTKLYYLNDKLHNDNGPAIERANGDKYWYLNGEELTEEEFINKTSKKIEKDNNKINENLYNKIKQHINIVFKRK